MSAVEIAVSYKLAKSPREQINILADLNVCNPTKIQEILAREGIVQEKPIKQVGKPTDCDWIKARELYDKGLSDPKIGAIIGASKKTVLNWRRKNRLVANH